MTKPIRCRDDGPWFWISKAARDLIRERCDATGTVATALAAYSALCEIANDMRAEEFQTTISHIVARSGLKDRCVRLRLKELSDLGLVKIVTPPLKAPSTYTLLPVRQQEPDVRHDMPHDRHQEPSVRHPAKFHQMPPYQEGIKNNQKGKSSAPAGSGEFVLEGEVADAPAQTKRFIPPKPEEVTTYSTEIGYPLDGQAWCDSYAQKGWLVGKAKMKDWRAAVRNWKANGWSTGKSQEAQRNRAPEEQTFRIN